MKTTMKHFAFLELGHDCESPMIGVISNISENKLGLSSLKNRLVTALQDHFDYTDIILTNKLPDFFNICGVEDFEIQIEEKTYNIRVTETWIY